MEPKGSQTVGARWKSGSVGKPGRRQTKIQRKTCEDRTKNSEKIEAKPERKSTSERRKIDEKSMKNGQKSTKNWFRSFLGAPGRSKSLRSRAGTRSGRSPTTKLGRLGRQVGHLGCHVGRLGREVGSPGHSKRRSKASSNACASSNGVRFDFSSFLLRSWKARTSIFVSQYSVSYTSHEVSTERALVMKI